MFCFSFFFLQQSDYFSRGLEKDCKTENETKTLIRPTVTLKGIQKQKQLTNGFCLSFRKA